MTSGMIWNVDADGDASGSSVGGSWSRPIVIVPPIVAAVTIPAPASPATKSRVQAPHQTPRVIRIGIPPPFECSTRAVRDGPTPRSAPAIRRRRRQPAL